MPENLTDIFGALEAVAAYDGAWSPLANEIATLRTRLDELRARETRLDDLLVVALVGGSGVGKSTLLNALAGDELAETSEYRPCTTTPTIYHPPGARLDFPQEWRRVSGSALENLVIVDTPDSDTIIGEHRERVIDVLGQCDLILMCADAEKYLDEATWSLLRPLRDERAIACVETKATQAPSVESHWRGRLTEQGFTVDRYFRVNSLRSLDRKIAARAAADDEYDFGALEKFLAEELTRERIARIKKSNTAGLLSKTVGTLDQRVCTHKAELLALRAALGNSATEMSKEAFDIVRRRLFAQPHLWNFALGRETGVRAKGLVGTAFRLLEYVRTLPARLSGWSLLSGKGSPGQRAAALLADKQLVDDSLDLGSGELRNRYLARQSELGVHYARAGFEVREIGAGFDRFHAALNDSISSVLRGPARDRIVARARFLTSWPLTILLDLPPVGFFGYSAYNIVKAYFSTELLSGAFFVHAGSVFGIILATELFAFSIAGRMFAWQARRATINDLRTALSAQDRAFSGEAEALETAIAQLESIERVRAVITER